MKSLGYDVVAASWTGIVAPAPAYLDPGEYTKLWIDTETRMRPILQTLQEK